MAWLLFMDESGHSHKELPYEVRGGYALADTHLWPFVQDVLRLELSCFGARLADYKSEVKGMKLLQKDRFEHAAQMPEFEAIKRQQLCRALLQAGLEKRPPTRKQVYGLWPGIAADGRRNFCVAGTPQGNDFCLRCATGNGEAARGHTATAGHSAQRSHFPAGTVFLFSGTRAGDGVVGDG